MCIRDSFNEVALSHQNNQQKVELSLPSAQHILPLTQLANDDVSVMKAIVKISELKNNLSIAINKLESCTLALCHSWRSLQVKELFDRYQRKILKYDKEVARNSSKIDNSDSLVSLKKMSEVLEDEVAFAKIAENWYKSCLLYTSDAADD